MATTDRWFQPAHAADTDGDEIEELAGDVRWLAPDARPAMTAVLDVLEGRRGATVADVADATGFTADTVGRILRELTTAGTVDRSAGKRASRYRRQRS